MQILQDVLSAVLHLATQTPSVGPNPMDIDPQLQGRHPAADLKHSAAAAARGPSPNSTAIATAAGRVFGGLLGSGVGQRPGCLNDPERIFGKPRVLWRQRAFTTAADLLVQVDSALHHIPHHNLSA